MGYHRAAPDPGGFPDQVFFPDAARPAGRSPVDGPGHFVSPPVSSPPPGRAEPAGQDPQEKNRRAQERKEKTVIEDGETGLRKQGQKSRPAEADDMPGPVILIAPQPGMGRNGEIQPSSVPKRIMKVSEEGHGVR